jgi:hypothetical protein
MEFVMKINIEIPEYLPTEGIRIEWEKGFTIAVRIDGDQVIIQADKPGLISLARQLLTLAQDQIPSGHHIHYDEFNSLEEGSDEMIIEKM